MALSPEVAARRPSVDRLIHFMVIEPDYLATSPFMQNGVLPKRQPEQRLRRADDRVSAGKLSRVGKAVECGGPAVG